MRLKSLKLKNFRCYKDEVKVDFENLTGFIGKNDAGKSTILEALEIFFNNNVVKIDKDDFCKAAIVDGKCQIEITCIFDDLPSEVIIDVTNPTSLKDEFLLNADGDLEIKKRYTLSSKIQPTTFIKAIHPNAAGFSDLLQATQIELKKRITANTSIPKTDYDLTKNASMRSALWSSCPDLEHGVKEIPVDKADSNAIWGSLEKHLPVYALFQSDRKSRDDDKEVTDPMDIAIKEAIKKNLVDLERIQKDVMDMAIGVAEKTLEKLSEMHPGLAKELKPEFKKDPKWESLFSLSLASDDGIPINKRGSGVRRLILLNFFRAEAERRRHTIGSSVIFAFEEPETSQHPDHQRIIVDAFQELADAKNTQVILTTHTPSIGGLMLQEQLRFVTKDDSGCHVVEVEPSDAQFLKKVANTLGVLPEIDASKIKLIVCVEGPRDVEFLKNVCAIVRQKDASIPSIFDDGTVAIISLGGSALKDWVEQNYLQGFGKPEMHLYDRDTTTNPKYQTQVDAVNARPNGCYAVLTTKREMENYIHHDAISRSLLITMSSFTDWCDVPEIVAELVHNGAVGSNPWGTLTPEQIKQKSSQAKKRLNQLAVKEMTMAELAQMDSSDEVVGWFKKMKSYVDV